MTNCDQKEMDKRAEGNNYFDLFINNTTHFCCTSVVKLSSVLSVFGSIQLLFLLGAPQRRWEF